MFARYVSVSGANTGWKAEAGAFMDSSSGILTGALTGQCMYANAGSHITSVDTQCKPTSGTATVRRVSSLCVWLQRLVWVARDRTAACRASSCVLLRQWF